MGGKKVTSTNPTTIVAYKGRKGLGNLLNGGFAHRTAN